MFKAVMAKTQIFCDRFFDRMDKITELGGLVWLDRMTGFFSTHQANFFEKKSEEDQFRRIINHRGHGEHGGEAASSRRFSLREWGGPKSKTLPSELEEVLFLACSFRHAGILRGKLDCRRRGQIFDRNYSSR